MYQDSINKAKADFNNAVEHLKEEYRGLQIGRASATLVENIEVEAYGSMQPLKGVANVSIPDAQTIQIKAWDKSIVPAIEKAIRNSNVQLNPNNDGETVRLNVPPLTEERRKELCKIVKSFEEKAHISVRTARQKAHDQFKKLLKDKEITEDDSRAADTKLQEAVDEANNTIKALSKKKEEDIMTV